MAGRTALIIWLRQRLLNPRVVISLAKIPDFDRISFDEKNGPRLAPGRSSVTSNWHRLSAGTIPASMRPFTSSPTQDSQHGNYRQEPLSG